ncbi:MAG: DUF2203 domain-containing protein [Dehalococcoidia bacterium]
MKRLFTIDEVRALLPRARALATELRASKQAYERHHAAIDLLATRAAGEGPQALTALERHHVAVNEAAGRFRSLAEAAVNLGIEVKGIDEGLLDFPSERDGRVVYLCWKLDEPDISWWHDLDTGYRGRQPL